MAVDWRDTLRKLATQFEARAARSSGLHHLFVEVADNERSKLSGPAWFAPYSRNIPVIDGKPRYQKWDASAPRPLPGISPGFREPESHETFDENDSHRAVRDGSGAVRAVSVPMKLRQGYFCGQPPEEVSGFESLANAAAAALAGSNSLHEHVFAFELTDIFRKPYVGVRYVFGEVPSAPNQFMAQGWSAGVVQFENGVLIDVPISERTPDASNWLLLLHRLGWRNIRGSGLRAERKAWHENVEVALEMLSKDWSQFPEGFAKQFGRISKESFYSVLGTKDAPLDVNLASAFAIQLLLDDLSLSGSTARTQSEVLTDYSREPWKTLTAPKVCSAAQDEFKKKVHPTQECAGLRPGILGGISPVSNGTC